MHRRAALLLRSSFDLPFTTISLVQGDALGGGFEAALAGDVVIAEKSAQFGFPEVMFNLFPGNGGIQLPVPADRDAADGTDDSER